MKNRNGVAVGLLQRLRGTDGYLEMRMREGFREGDCAIKLQYAYSL